MRRQDGCVCTMAGWLMEAPREQQQLSSALVRPATHQHTCSRSADDLFNILKQNFDAAYHGNRAPLPVFIHTPWCGIKVHLDGWQCLMCSQPCWSLVTCRQLPPEGGREPRRAPFMCMHVHGARCVQAD